MSSTQQTVAAGVGPPLQTSPGVGPPLWLLLELTYRCPLHCVFCYNPTEFAHTAAELETADWLRVLREARALGAVQLGLSGGEPLVREDLETIVAEAHTLGFYSNLITSGIGMTEARIGALKQAGLDHIQLSFQDSTRAMNDFLSSTRTFELKSKVAALIRKHDYPMVLNVVLHRLNIDHVDEILAMAEAMGAQYVELANTQYYGWAVANQDALLPTWDQLRRGEEAVQRFRERVGPRVDVLWVLPDFYEEQPKPCMGGWGRTAMVVAPNGEVLPCQAASTIPGLEFANVCEHSLEWIWSESEAFTRFRGTDWMQEPCRSCPLGAQEVDWGGCRCQAMRLTGDAAATDPVCRFSPHHDRVVSARESGETDEFVYRTMKRPVRV
jgi:PqqA peptide cyclase